MYSTEESDDDDEVVKEMDVYLSKTLCGQLYLLQYPVQNAKRRYRTEDRRVAQIKPKNKKIEMEVALDISSPNYDQSKGEQIALNVDGAGSSFQSSSLFETNVMDKQILHSICVPTQGKRYVAGFIQNDEVHLTPVSQVMQLKPSFKYMDKAEQRATQAAKAKSAAEGDSSQDEAEEAKAVTIRFKGSETEAARLARERSYAAYEKRISEEKWIATSFHSKKESYAERERRRLLCQNVKHVDVKSGVSSSGFSEMVQTPAQYLSEIVPVYSEHAIDNRCLPENVVSLSRLEKETLSDQLKILMKSAKIIRFCQLMTLLPKSPDVSTVVRSLQSFGVLVKGCWIVKSEVLYPAGSLSAISGTPAESMCKARDYILFLFTKNEYVVRKEVTSTVKLPGDDIKAILDDIAVIRFGHGWKLRIEPDKDFMRRFPEVCERQSMLWDAQSTKLAKYYHLPCDGVNRTGDGAKESISSPPRRKKTNSTSVSPKQTAKASSRQRKNSGVKSSSSKPNNTSKITKKKQNQADDNQNKKRTSEDVDCAKDSSINDHHEKPMLSKIQSPPIVKMEISETPAMSTVGEFQDTNCSGNLAEGPATTPPRFTGSTKINMDGVNTTVQLIASQMLHMSPQFRPINDIPNGPCKTNTGDTVVVKQEAIAVAPNGITKGQHNCDNFHNVDRAELS